MPRGVEFDNTGKILRSHHSVDLNQVYFRPDDPIILADIYWGKWSGITITSSLILQYLTGATGYVGSASGRLYTFPSTPTSMYFYWCIPNYANDGTNGDKIIKYAIEVGKVPPNYTGLKTGTPYTTQQVNPTPVPNIYYTIVSINGVNYRVYRSTTNYAGGTILNQLVYSY